MYMLLSSGRHNYVYEWGSPSDGIVLCSGSRAEAYRLKVQAGQVFF